MEGDSCLPQSQYSLHSHGSRGGFPVYNNFGSTFLYMPASLYNGQMVRLSVCLSVCPSICHPPLAPSMLHGRGSRSPPLTPRALGTLSPSPRYSLRGGEGEHCNGPLVWTFLVYLTDILKKNDKRHSLTRLTFNN